MKAIASKKKAIQGETTTPVFNREGKRRLKRDKKYGIAHAMLQKAAMEKILNDMEVMAANENAGNKSE